MANLALSRGESVPAVTARGFNPRRFAGPALLYGVLIAGAAFTTFPFLWMIDTSLKNRTESLANPPTLVPKIWHFSNYVDAWRAAPFARYFFNTFFISFAVAGAIIVTATLAAYAFARLDFYGRNVLFVLLLSTLMIPFESIIIPNFIILKHLHWLNTYPALIVPFSASVFSVFLLRQHFAGLPQDLFDSAQLDGASHLRILLSIVLPLSRGPLAAIALFAFLGSWNSLLWPLIVTNSQSLRPIQLGLSVFLTQDTTEPQLLMAASAFTIAPIMVLYFLAQRQFMEGFASSGIK